MQFIGSALVPLESWLRVREQPDFFFCEVVGSSSVFYLAFSAQRNRPETLMNLPALDFSFSAWSCRFETMCLGHGTEVDVLKITPTRKNI